MNNLLTRYKTLAIIVGIVLTLLGSLTIALIIYTWDKGEIASGVVLEIPLDKLRIEEARSKLEQTRNQVLATPIHFTSDQTDVSMTTKELGLTYTFDAELQQAYSIGREGILWKKAMSKFKASWGITFKPQYLWDDKILKETLNKSLSSLNVPATDARFTVTSDDTMEIVSEKPGKQVDVDSLITNVKKSSLNQTVSISIPFKEVAPSITRKELETLKMTDLLGTYTTHFDPNQIGRTQNIKLASKALDGTLIKPQEVFSFNQTVGPRTAESGYQMAIIIEGDKFVPGLGGGVCQVSSTLFNAVQQASLEIVERSHHSLAITYVPQGQDATVAYPSLDFKFKNTSGSYILIRTSIQGGTLTIKILKAQKV
ncbi:MAG: VanW family protein [Bacillota bacterium]|nr:VanW family protein [Bacillota bacterium]